MGKTMKKVMAGAVAVGMLSAGMVTAYAAEQTGSMAVQYTKTHDSSFTLSIPSTVVLDETKEVYETVGVTAIDVTDSEKVQISVSEGITDGSVTLTGKEDTSRTITSKVSLTENNTGDGIAADAVVAEFADGTTTATTGGTLYFAPVGEEAEVGTYEGTITFSASIVAKN